MFLTTNGGDPDAYKISRYLQEKYKHFAVVVSGKCKSAGTLIALGAHEIVFTPYGELGPLDIQLAKVDRFDQMQSGLAIQDALNTLEDRALERFFTIVKDYIQSNRGMISFGVAAKAASDFVTQLYAPVFARVDPEEVGARTRSMRIASDYGQRLSLKSQNLKPDTLRLLAETYSSHSFVIDQQEAEGLFERVRQTSDEERGVAIALERLARFPATSEPAIYALHDQKAAEPTKKQNDNKEMTDGKTHQGRDPKANGGDPEGPASSPNSPPSAGANGSGPRRRSRGAKGVEAQ